VPENREKVTSRCADHSLKGKPLLVDAHGPCDVPITGNTRVKVTAETTRAWLVAYLPAGVVAPERAEEKLRELVEVAPAGKILIAAAS
jgi:DNA/RNA-binding domain of Phe-tRNA-synthetase-like protein